MSLEITVTCHEVGQYVAKTDVGAMWKEGDVIWLRIPGSDISLDEKNLGPRYVDIDEDEDEDDDKTSYIDIRRSLSIKALSIRKQALMWDVQGDIPDITVVSRVQFKTWFCMWSLSGGVLTIHGVNKTALDQIPHHDIHSVATGHWGGQLAPLYTPTERRGGLASIGCSPGFDPPPILEFAHFRGDGTLSILQTSVSATTGGKIG